MASAKFWCGVLVLFFHGTFVKAWEDLEVIPFHLWSTQEILKKPNMTSIPVHVMLSQTMIEPCFSLDQCIDVLNLKTLLVFVPSFFIGGDGRVYVGYGWDVNGVQNICSNDKNESMIDVGFIGDFRNVGPTTQQLRAAQKLLEYGLQTGKLSETYKLFGEWQFVEENFPINNETKEHFKTWPHWTSNLTQCEPVKNSDDDKESSNTL